MVNNAEIREAHMEPLTAHDRCDRCGAQAFARTRHARRRPEQENDVLLWCRHHYREHGNTLAPSLVYVEPEQEREPVGA